MNWYAQERLAEQHREALLREAEEERLARQARGGGYGQGPAIPVQLKVAFAVLAAILALTVAGPMLGGAV